MMQKTMRALAVLAVLALSSGVDAATRKATNSNTINNSSMSLGDGTYVNSTTNSTEFLETEYNPDRCVLQLASLECNVTKNDCGALNGYPLECVKLGLQNGKQKYQCQCRGNETDVCQRTTAPTTTGVPQFGDCSNNQQCVDSYGHVSSSKEGKICAEKIHCVKEINTTATVPAEICHTCRSCIAQNDAANAKLSDKRRFDCTKICPKEVTDSIAKRNEQGVGIADELSSASASESGSGEEESSTNGSADAAASETKAPASSFALASVSATTLVASIVVASLSAVVLL